ncbi:MAG: phosphoribosylanthranilate isomerase [Candidatus Acidiferrales bacterium]
MVLVKICGITNAPDARAACEAGANFLGFNFYEKSPRYIAPADASKIRSQLPKNVEVVGIFVDAKPAAIASLSASVRLDAAQLHGDETPSTVAEVARAIRVFKAFRVGPDFSLATLDQYPDAFAFLLDAAHAGQYGGTGRTTDWALARRAALSSRIILTGGLNVENVAAAIRLVRPFAVDVASGVESKPGKKDHGRLRDFIQEVRRAERELEEQPEISRES